MPQSGADHSVVESVPAISESSESSGFSSPIQIWSADGFQDLQESYSKVFDKGQAGGDKSADHLLPKVEFDSKDSAVDLDSLAEKLSHADNLASSPVGRLLSNAVSEASARGQGSIDELVEGLNKLLGPDGLSVKVSPGDSNRRPIASYNITLMDRDKGASRGSVTADGRGLK